MTYDELRAHVRAKIEGRLAERVDHVNAREALRGPILGENRDPNDSEAASIEAADSLVRADDEVLTQWRDELATIDRQETADNEAADLSRQVTPTNGPRPPAYDRVARVGAESRTYSPDTDRSGSMFLRDVGAAFLGNHESAERISRHMSEERVERAGYLDRAAGTSAFAGLTVPQYLTDLYAPNAKASRPFADAINKHDLPGSGMTVNISKITTGTSAALQANQNTAVSETDIDDTLLTINVLTNAGQQTLSRQAIERGTGVEGVMLDDLFRAYHTTLDSTLITQAATGLNAVATSNLYDDATPTVSEAYPKVIGALAAVESALLDQDAGDNLVVMHSRRWYWLQNGLVSTWPLIAQPGIDPRNAGENYGVKYGAGYRGVLPNGTPVVVDNNIGTALGAGTEDAIYVVSRRECHLWEDPAAPLLIRAEQTPAASLGVLFVVYGYFAYTHTRQAHAQKINGTGLIAPSF